MQLTYQWDPALIEIQETKSAQDTEFEIHLLADHPYTDAMKRIEHDYESNKVLTDVSFYVYQNHRYRVIVRNDFYDDFILQLMKYRLLRAVEWK